MKVGFLLSPGGLLLPYHLGVLDALEHHGFVNENTPLAGSSAGAIATASKAAKIDSRRVLESTMNICDQCFALGGARGRIMPLLKQNLVNHVGAQEFDTVQKRSGPVAIAYMEIFPEQKSVLQTGFRDRFDLISAVCQSSMFPFFTSNWPAILDTSRQQMRLCVDGAFTVPMESMGCPDFSLAGVKLDRTIRVSVIPPAIVGGSNDDVISPRWEGAYQLGRLLRLATEGGSRPEVVALYDSGWGDAEKWCRLESSRHIESFGQLN
jgi:hypothetical protein